MAEQQHRHRNHDGSSSRHLELGFIEGSETDEVSDVGGESDDDSEDSASTASSSTEGSEEVKKLEELDSEEESAEDSRTVEDPASSPPTPPSRDRPTKMLSMSCNSASSAADVFGQSLQAKLHFLEAEARAAAARQHGDDDDDDDDDEEEDGGVGAAKGAGEASSPSACSHGWLGQHQQRHRRSLDYTFPVPGTTFPPRTCAQFDLLKAKYHSETDLQARHNAHWLQQAKDLVVRELLTEAERDHSASEEARRRRAGDDEEPRAPMLVRSRSRSRSSSSSNSQVSEDEDEDDEEEKKHSQRQRKSLEGNDSDLFFDFDIESPQEAASSSTGAKAAGGGGERAQLLHKLSSGGKTSAAPTQVAASAPKDVSSGNSSNGNGNGGSLPRRNSVDSFFSAGGDSNSTAFGSMSSFDGDLAQRKHEEQEQNLSLEPEDWIRKQQLGSKKGGEEEEGGGQLRMEAGGRREGGEEEESEDAIRMRLLINNSRHSRNESDDGGADRVTAAAAAAAEEGSESPKGRDADTGSEVDTVTSSSATPVASLSPVHSAVTSPPDVKVIAGTPTEEDDKRGKQDDFKEKEEGDLTLDSDSDSEDLEGFKVTTGDDRTHTVAKSKLNALIALLEKDREISPLSRSSSASRVETTDTSPAPSVTDLPAASSEPGPGGVAIRKKSFQTSLPTIAASPANFSFLTGATFKKTASADSEKEGASSSSSSSTSSGPLIRTSSMPAPSQDPNHLRVRDGSSSERSVPSKSERIRRASSLKSGKTPPGTPGHRKNVRFADVLGLDLANVKTFRDEIPRVPKSAYLDLTDIDVSDVDSDAGSSVSGSSASAAARRFLQFGAHASPQRVPPPSAALATTLVPMFNQPGSFPNFFELLRERKVCLENAYTHDTRSVQGTVRVQNLSFHKRVTVRYSVNEWASFNEAQATYVDGSCDGFSDKFTFAISFGTPMGVGSKLQLCIRFEAESGEFWDSNDGRNYVFQCLRSVSATPASVAIKGAPRGAAPAGAASGPSPSSSAAMSFSGGHPASASAHGHQPYSHSPSSMLGEDPWHRYL